jgi:Skp family chaperone for outer membrane proteins
MTRWVVFAVPLVVACAHTPGGGRPAAPVDIGVVDLQWVLTHVADGQAAKARLKRMVGSHPREVVEEREQVELRVIFKKMDPVLQGLAQARGFRFVIEATDGGVLYAVPVLDLTRELAEVYDRKHGVEGSAAPQTTDTTWVDDATKEKLPGAAVVFGKNKSGLTFAPPQGERAAGQATARIGICDVTKLGPIFTPLDIERQRTGVRKVAEQRGLALVLSKGHVMSATVIDITDEVVQALPPGGPISQ